MANAISINASATKQSGAGISATFALRFSFAYTSGRTTPSR